MPLVARISGSARQDMLAGAIAGLAGGVVSGWALLAQDQMVQAAGLLGLSSSGGALVLHLVISALVGAGFGVIFRRQPGAASTTMTGVLYGLLWWIAGPLTLTPLLSGDAPSWSLVEAGAAFPSLVAHLLYGGILGLLFHAVAGRLGAGTAEEPDEEPHRTRVVILGGGFGGLSTAQTLEQIFARDPSLDITLVSQSNFLLFTPMLAEVASSGLEAQHISAPVRAALPRTDVRRAEVERIDTDPRAVWIRPAPDRPLEALPYDHLVLGLGAVPNFHGLPGLAEHAFTLKTLHDAALLRNHVIGQYERADAEPDPELRRRMLTFVVAGAGFAGTELIAELFDLGHSIRRFYPHVRPGDARFILVHSQDRILPELSAELARYSQQKLAERGLEFVLGARVSGATANTVQLADGRMIPTNTLVWTAGHQPNPVLATLPCEHNRAGAVVAEATLQVTGLPNVWAVGDCAQIPDLTTDGKSCPPTAQHALRQGKTLAHNIAATMQGKPLKQFRFRTIGLLVGLGHRTAAAEVYGRRFSGLLAWMMWRSIYLSKLPGLERKVRVALDWTIDLFFPRDIVLTASPPPPTLAEMTTPERARRMG